MNLHNDHEKGTFSLILSNSEKTIKSWSDIFAQAVIWENIPVADNKENIHDLQVIWGVTLLPLESP